VADAQQGGVISTGQLRLGLTQREIGGWVQRGWLFPMYPGVFAVGRRQPAWQGRARSVVVVRAGLLSQPPVKENWQSGPASDRPLLAGVQTGRGAGRPNYHSAVRDMERDRVKDGELLLMGIRTVRITDLRFELEPRRILAEARAADSPRGTEPLVPRFGKSVGAAQPPPMLDRLVITE
jgi:hypothetical protein